MPRKPTLSPSKISTYLACPVKYRWTYIDDRGKWYLRSKSYYSFGLTLHKVLERFHNTDDAGVQTVHQALAAFEENWIEAGFSSAEEMAEAFGEGKEIIERHIEEAVSQPSVANTILVEKMLRKDLGEFVLIGRLDRVDEYEDGTIEVVDYKSGRSGVSEEEVATDLAMCCYQLLLRHHFPDRPVRATILALRSGTSASASLSDEEAAQFEKDLIVLGITILNRDYADLEPVPKALCPTCDFLPLCKKHREFELPLVALDDANLG
jgi:RecB family exonuclease